MTSSRLPRVASFSAVLGLAQKTEGAKSRPAFALSYSMSCRYSSEAHTIFILSVDVRAVIQKEPNNICQASTTVFLKQLAASIHVSQHSWAAARGARDPAGGLRCHSRKPKGALSSSRCLSPLRLPRLPRRSEQGPRTASIKRAAPKGCFLLSCEIPVGSSQSQRRPTRIVQCLQRHCRRAGKETGAQGQSKHAPNFDLRRLHPSTWFELLHKTDLKTVTNHHPALLQLSTFVQQ